jgi:VanZ family protein
VLARRVARFAPPVLWMAVIAVFSGGFFAADETGSWLLPLVARWFPWASPGQLHALHVAIRKLGHLTEYGILAALWLRAFPGRPRADAWAVLLSVLYAGVDEWRQGLAPNRSPSLLDVGVDAAGALVAVGCLRPHTGLGGLGLRLLRWGAVAVAVGSLAAAVLDWSLGLGAWDLLAATVGATAAAMALRRLERAWRAPT